jgi:uncharacterized membrane protein (UPF0127 family)
MKILIASKNNFVLAEKVEKAHGLYSRMKGLLGKKYLAEKNGLWIPACNSVHTFFMRFTIDAIFLDKNLKVCALYPKLSPWRMTRIVWKANSVLELAAGTTEKTPLAIGDQLHVVP